MTSSISSSTWTSNIASNLFSKLDTKNKGYLEKSDLQSAFSAISSDSDSSGNVDDVFSQLDSDGDGKVTKDEMTSSLQKLAEELDNQFTQARMQQAGGMPPPPPPQNDEGFTKDELQSQLDEIGSTDSQRSSLISKVVSNFSAADTNSDGKVTAQEAMTYNQKTTTNSTDGQTGSSASSSSSSNNEMSVLLRIMQLANAYGVSGNDSSASSLSSQISTSA